MGNIKPGIRLELKAHGNNVEKLFYIKPGADPGKIHMTIKGVKTLQINAAGQLVLSNNYDTMRFSKPLAFQYINGRRYDVPIEYYIQDRTYGFKIGTYDPTVELIIDPLISSIAYPKGKYADFRALAADSSGNVYAAGFGDEKCMIVKLDAKIGNILALIVFGGSRPAAQHYEHEMINAIGIDSKDNIFVAGITEDADFPITDNCYDNQIDADVVFPPNWEGFITKFNSDLEMLASAFLGGDGYDKIF